MMAKPVIELTAEDLAGFPVWEYDIGEESLAERDETWVVPVIDLPVSSLSGRAAGVSLKVGSKIVVGLLGNVDLEDPISTREFATLSILQDGTWFHLARYFDSDRERHGQEALAEMLGLSISELFPIHYDLSGIAVGHPEVLKGRIDANPMVTLTDEERMALIIQRP